MDTLLVIGSYARDVEDCLNTGQSDITFVIAENASDAIEHLKTQTFRALIVSEYLDDMGLVSFLRSISEDISGLPPYPVVVIREHAHDRHLVDVCAEMVGDCVPIAQLTDVTLMNALFRATRFLELAQRCRRAETELLHARKLEAVGRLAGGVFHDFNNLLTIMFGNTRLLNTLLQDDNIDRSGCMELTYLIKKSAERGANLLKRLMTFARPRASHAAPTDINELIVGLQELLQRSLSSAVTIKSSLAADLWQVQIEQGQFENALINLAFNARDAMPNGGEVSITTQNVTLAGNEAEQRGLTPGSYVQVIVSDTGTGIDDDIRDKIFDPFFTTKDAGKGSGLGLSMVASFVSQSGGVIRLGNAAERGADFEMYFPQAVIEDLQPASPGQTGLEEDVLKGRGEGILVVEDEAEILALTTRLLEEYGYRVISAENGAMALVVLEERKDEIHLLFTDMTMPGRITGSQLAARALLLKPDLKVLFTTGYAKNNVPDMSVIRTYPMIDKPYQSSKLAQKIRDVLDAKTQLAARATGS